MSSRTRLYLLTCQKPIRIASGILGRGGFLKGFYVFAVLDWNGLASARRQIVLANGWNADNACSRRTLREWLGSLTVGRRVRVVHQLNAAGANYENND